MPPDCGRNLINVYSLFDDVVNYAQQYANTVLKSK